MNENLLQKLSQILNVDKIMSPEDVLAIKEAIIGILANNKKEVEGLTQETKVTVEAVLNKILDEHDTYLKNTEKMAQEVKSSTSEAVKQAMEEMETVKRLCKEVMDSKPKDGEDADEEKIVADVLAQIKLPEYKEVILDDGGQIVDKINALPVNEENQIDASHIKNLPKVKSVGGGITQKRVLQLIEENGGSGSPGGSTTQLQYNNAGSFGGISGATTDGTVTTFASNGLKATNIVATTSAGFLIEGNSGTDVALFGAGGGAGATFYGGVNIAGELTVDTNTLYVDPTNNRTGLLTTAPTHTLTLASTSTGIALYNTADQTTNYERVLQSWASNVFTIASQIAGTGTQRTIRILGGDVGATNTAYLDVTRANAPHFLFTNNTATGSIADIGFVKMQGRGAASSGTQGGLAVTPVWTQTGTAGYTALLVNPTETTTGSGSKLLADFQVGGVSKHKVFNDGVTHIIMPDTSTSILSTVSNSPGGTTGLEFRYNSVGGGTNIARIMAVVGTGGGGDINFDTAAGGGSAYSTKATIKRAGDFYISGTIELGNVSDTTLSRSSAGVLAVEGVVIPSISSTNTLTNKFITPQLQSVADAGGTLTPVAITNDVVIATALSQATTIAAPTGSPVQGEKLVIRLKDNGTARALTWNAIYRAIGVTLPTTTVINKTVYCGFIYNSTDTKWDCVAVAQEA